MAINPAQRLIQLMEEVVTYSVKHVHVGGIPFTAFVVDQHGLIVGRGVNRVREQHDPTAHAEVEAIRDACRKHGATHLYGATLLASGEPCAMCYMSALYVGVSQIFFAADPGVPVKTSRGTSIGAPLSCDCMDMHIVCSLHRPSRSLRRSCQRKAIHGSS